MTHDGRRFASGATLFCGDVSVDAGRSSQWKSASVLKPLQAWAASRLEPYETDLDVWAALARASTVHSDNDAARLLWAATNPGSTLDVMSNITGVPWETAPAATFGSVMVSPRRLATGYRALHAAAKDGDQAAAAVIGWMREVPDSLTFGVRAVIVEQFGVMSSFVGVKAGWYCSVDSPWLRTHVAAAFPDQGRTVVAAVVSAVELDDAERSTYSDAIQSGSSVTDWHRRLGAPLLDARLRELFRKSPIRTTP